jgi:hypothetical protein
MDAAQHSHKENTMAYITQDQKKEIAAILKARMPKEMKYSLSIRHHSTIEMTIYSAPVDLLGMVNAHNKQEAEWRSHPFHECTKSVQGIGRHPEIFGDYAPIIEAAQDALNLNNYDRSDSQSDYFEVGHYVRMDLGRFDRPFQVQS